MKYRSFKPSTKNLRWELIKIKHKQPPVMRAAAPEQRQALCSTVQATLQMLVDADMKLYSEVHKDTLKAIQTQGFILQNGTVQKERIVQSAKEKTSLQAQLRTAKSKMKPSLHSKSKTKSGAVR